MKKTIPKVLVLGVNDEITQALILALPGCEMRFPPLSDDGVNGALRRETFDLVILAGGNTYWVESVGNTIRQNFWNRGVPIFYVTRFSYTNANLPREFPGVTCFYTQGAPNSDWHPFNQLSLRAVQEFSRK